MSSFFKRTIKCENCGRPTQTIFVCPECFAKIPPKDRQAFRSMYINKQDTASKRASILARLKTAGQINVMGLMFVLICIIGLSAIGLMIARFPKKRAAPVITPAPAVQWLGSPVVAQERATGHLTNVEFGIRDDGVVIWRDKRGPAVNGRRFGQFEDGPAPFLPIPPFTKAPNATAK